MSSQPQTPQPYGTLSILPPEIRYMIYRNLIPSQFIYDILTPGQCALALQNLICANHHFKNEIARNIAPSLFTILKQKIKTGAEIEYILDLRTSTLSFDKLDNFLERFLRQVRRMRKRYQTNLRGRLVFYPSIPETKYSDAKMLGEVCEEATVIENLGLDLKVKEVKILFEEEWGVDMNQFLVLSAPILRSGRVGEEQECGTSQGQKEGDFLVLTADPPRVNVCVREHSTRIGDKVAEWWKICQSRELINEFPISGTIAQLVHPDELELEDLSDFEEPDVVAGEVDWMQSVNWDQEDEVDWPRWKLWVDDILEFPVEE